MEQRLFRPVFEDIDRGRPGSALNQLQTLAKKTPKIATNPTFQALKCLCHQRLGEDDQAIEVFETLLKDDQEKKTSTGSSSKGKAAARGKGGRQALLKKIQKVQTAEPTEGEEVEDKQTEAADGAAAAPRTRVFDDGVINVLQFALRGLGKYQELRKIYLDAWNADNQKDLEKGAQAFLCSLRSRDWSGMQDTALLLLKHSQDPKMAHWAAMSLYLQATDRKTPSKSKPLLLSLAYSLLTSSPANPYRTPDVFILWVRICRAAGQTHRALPSITEGPGVKNGSALEKEALEALTPDLRKAEKDVEFEAGWWTAVAGDLRIKWERWELVGEIAERLIEGAEVKQSSGPEDARDVDEQDVPDADETDVQGTIQGQQEVSWAQDWDWEKEWERGDDQIRGAADLPETNYKAYITHLSVLFLLLSKPELVKDSAKSPATYLAETQRTLLDLASQSAFVKKERAPLMALLAINKKLDTLGLSVDSEGSGETATIKVLSRYLEEFGHKGCVRDDLLPYLQGREGCIEPAIRSTLEAMVTETTSEYKSYMRNLNARKLLRRALPLSDRDAEIEAGKVFLMQYFAGAAYGKDLPVTDVRPADDYALMAAQAWINAWRLDKDAKDARTYLVLAIVALERNLRDSPANGQARMLLIRLYRLIGAPSLIVEHIAPLKMRTFQQDTALHFVTERSTPDYVAGGEKTRTALASLLLQCKQVYEKTQGDVGETSVAGFTEEAYSQVPSMLELGDKFQHSHQRQLTELELVRHSAMRDSSELLGADRSVAIQNLSLYAEDTAVDVRDWDLFPDFGTAHDEGLIQQTQLGKLSTPSTVRAGADLWTSILDPASERRLEISVDSEGPAQNTTDRIMFDIGQAIGHFARACRIGESTDPTSICERLKDLAQLVPGEQGRQSMERAATLMECYAMLEIALTPYKVKAGKKGKGAAPSTVPQPVAEAVRTVFVSAQDIIRDFAANFKNTEATDILVGQNHVVDLVKALGLAEAMIVPDVRKTEQAVRESRQLATKEIFRELKRRSDG